MFLASRLSSLSVLTPFLSCSTPRSKRTRCALGTRNRRETGGSSARGLERLGNQKRRPACGSVDFSLLCSFCRAPLFPAVYPSPLYLRILLLLAILPPTPVSRYAVKSSLRGLFFCYFSFSPFFFLFVLSDTSLALSPPLQCLSSCGQHNDVLLWT